MAFLATFLRLLANSELYTIGKRTYARTIAPAKSTIECCFSTKVAKQMETINRNEAIRTARCLRRDSLWVMAKCTPMELNTWMLGNMLVGVSVERSKNTNLEHKFLSGLIAPLKSVPLGNRVQITKLMVMPVNRNIHKR